MSNLYLDDLLAIAEQLPDQDVEKVLDFAQFLLSRSQTPQPPETNPYIEILQARSGPQAMIRGSRVSVAAIVAYIRPGETPESIASDVLPFLHPAQIHDALRYYYDHQPEIDAELAGNTESASMTRLREQLREEDFYRLTGSSRCLQLYR